MNLGRTRERRIANSLDWRDVSTIVATLEFFGVEDNLLKQTVYDLRVPRYRLFDWLATSLDRESNYEKDPVEDSRNIWVALAQVYLNTSNPRNFVEYLRFMDLQLDEGAFTSEAFIKKIKEWDETENKLLSMQARK
jgi:hypothetical protein